MTRTQRPIDRKVVPSLQVRRHHWMEAQIATPALTTVWNGQREVGRRAARALLDKLGGQSVRPSQELIKPELHIRQSTG